MSFLPRIVRNGERGKRGFTAFEVLLASAILAIITAAVSGAIAAGRQTSRNARNMVVASMLARSMMEETLRLPYTISPHTTPSGRSTFTMISDYDGYSDGGKDNTGANISITDITGVAYPSNFQGFSRSVAVSAKSYTPAGWGGSTTVNGMMITVTVSLNSQTLITMERFVSPF